MHRKLSGAAALIVAAAFVTAEEALLLAARAELDVDAATHDPLAR
jgi:hypothetical protein